MTETSPIYGATKATVHVPLDTRAYDVRIGTGLIASAGVQILPLLRRPKVAVVTDENVASCTWIHCARVLPQMVSK